GDRPLAELRQVDRVAQGSPDQALDLVGPPAELALDRFAIGPLGGRAGQHRVLGRDPAGALAAEMGRDAVGDRRRTQDAGVAEVDDARALGPFLDAELEADRTELGRDPAVGPDPGAVADHRVVSFAATA